MHFFLSITYTIPHYAAQLSGFIIIEPFIILYALEYISTIRGANIQLVYKYISDRP